MRKIIFILISLAFCGVSIFGAATENLDVITPLDQAYIDVVENQSDAQNYYSTFSDSLLYVFAVKKSKKPSIDGLASLQFRASHFEGRTVINIFDTLDRAKAFGKSRGFDDGEILAVQGGAAFTFMLEEYYLFLNPESKYHKLFSPEEVRYVAGLHSAIQMGEIKTNDILDLVVIADVDANLSSALIKAASGIHAVEKIYICKHPLEPVAPNGLNNYFLVIQKDRRGNQDIIQRLIYSEIQEHIKSGQFVDFIFASKKLRKKIMAKKQNPLYERLINE